MSHPFICIAPDISSPCTDSCLCNSMTAEICTALFTGMIFVVTIRRTSGNRIAMNMYTPFRQIPIRTSTGIISLLLLLLPPLFLPCSTARAKDSISLEDKTKAAFVYHFTKYIQWPEEDSSGTFTIGVLGKSNLTEPLNEISTLKKVGRRKIVIRQLDSISQCDPCHILFIADPERNDFNRVTARLQGSGTLTITDTEGYGKKGSCINFITRKGRLHFEMNRASLEKMHLHASSQLLKLAIIVNERGTR